MSSDMDMGFDNLVSSAKKTYRARVDITFHVVRENEEEKRPQDCTRIVLLH